MWPRLAAVAEVLWAGRGQRAEGLNTTKYSSLSREEQRKEDAAREKFRLRLHWFRCLLLRRGVAAEPTTTNVSETQLVGELGPPQPGGCFFQ